jgi:hypothetical protein
MANNGVISGDAAQKADTLEILRKSGNDLKKEIANRVDAFIEDFINLDVWDKD